MIAANDAHARKTKAHNLRHYSPGYVGGDFAKVATDADLLTMAELMASITESDIAARQEMRNRYRLQLCTDKQPDMFSPV